MGTPGRQLQHTQKMKFMKPEPVITYDHMNDLEHINYIHRAEKNMILNRTEFISEVILIAGMLVALFMLSF